MGYNVNQSLISSQPPLIIFTICLTTFGFVMIVLAYMVGEMEIPNPDVKMDWNRYLKKITDLRLCQLVNYTSTDRNTINGNQVNSLSALNSSFLHVVDESKSMSAVLSGVVDLAMDNKRHKSMFIEVSVAVQFKVRGKLNSYPPYTIKGQIKGNLLGFTGKYGRLIYNISLNVYPSSNNNCTSEDCFQNYDVCISMNWPADFLPKNRGPEKCKIKESSEILPVIFTELQIPDEESSKTCLELQYMPDVKLTEMLSLQERSIVNLHLMHTSYFMFFMVITLVCYALVKGRARHTQNYISLQKVLDA